MKTWLSSDHHFNHTNVIKYCNRPFDHILKMDNELISIWNSHVAPEDEVFYLGDLTLKDITSAAYYLGSLNGQIHFLSNPWHHDGRWLKKAMREELHSKSGYPILFEPSIVVVEDISMNEDSRDVPAILCHYAFEIWDRKHYGSLHFHGHSHGMLQNVHNRLDVGIDNVYKMLGEYRPIEMQEAIFLANSIL